MVRFEWDEKKAEANWRKHGVRFGEARAVFDDPSHLTFEDDTESYEERWQTIGIVGRRLMFVVHTVRENGDIVVRIISARYADDEDWREYVGRNRW